MALFQGLERAYGTYSLRRTKKTPGGKLEGIPKTVPEPVTRQLWDDHLSGREGIGIVPIRDDSTCLFGAIDVDIYTGIDVVKIISDIRSHDLPLVPCRTKSGGLHLYTFVNKPIPAELMREKLSNFSAFLGFGGSEIFPKQSEVIADRGDIGGWINMPYYDVEKTTRYAYRDDGEPAGVTEFLEMAKKFTLSPSEFKAFTVHVLSDISDGPPCLQYLITRGFSAGTRNDGLFNVAVYLKRAYPDDWETLLDDYNERFFDPSLSTAEVSGIIKSMKRKAYNFTCEKPPIKPYCNMTLCRSRPHGIGQLVGTPLLTCLTKYDSRPPVWFIDVDGGGRMELTTEELQSQTKFQKRCMEVLNQMPPTIKGTAWQGIIQGLLDAVTIIEAPIDASPRGMLLEYLERFCLSRAQARNRDELLLGKPWTDDGMHYFRIMDFIQFLERQRFKEFKVNKICSILKEIGGEHAFLKIKGKGLNVWKVPEFSKQVEPFDVPNYEGDEEVF